MAGTEQHPYRDRVRTTRSAAVSNHPGVDVMNGPVTAATEYLRWTTVPGSIANLILLGLVALVLAVALVPVEAADHRFGGPR